jgi:hypothetical protein
MNHQRARDALRRPTKAARSAGSRALDAERRLQASQDSAGTARAEAAHAAVATFRALEGGDAAG